jgi:hypothetical protein
MEHSVKHAASVTLHCSSGSQHIGHISVGIGNGSRCHVASASLVFHVRSDIM